MKQWFNNKAWKEWKTRKASFIGVIIFWIIFTITILILDVFSVDVSDTIINNVFDAGKWIITTGCAITVSKVFKGKTNSDDDEIEGEE